MRRMIASVVRPSALLRSALLAAATAGLIAPLTVVAQPAPATQPAGQAAVPVKVVVLFSSGVGYFEHDGNVKGGGSTELRFKSQQINDILKSLVLEDAGGGKVTAVTYPSQDPVEKTLKSFQVDINGNPSLGDLLEQLRGAKVKVTVAGGEAVAGTILGLEKRPTPTKGDKPIDQWILNLISGGVIRQVELAGVNKLELEDKTLQQELGRALEALAQSRDQDKKPVTINFAGAGERQIRIGYVVETPIWKTSYRLILGDGKGAKDAIQGWAIVENQTDNDWDNVQLTLVSGRPISFIQDLYQPLYVPRPTVQPELYASLKPQTYDAGMERGGRLEEFAAKDAAAAAGGAVNGPVAALGTRQMRRAGAQVQNESLYARDFAPQQAQQQLAQAMDVTKSVSSVASAAKLGELFQYTVGSVSLPRQRSAMIPIITDPVKVERLSIYNQSVLAKNPLTGARVTNTTGKHLLAGPVTVLQDNRYAGDASLDNVPPGQQRLISYGVDLDVTVDATKNRQDSQLLTGSIVKGVLKLQRKHVFSQDYLAENKSDHDKALLIEHPIRQGWHLIDTDKENAAKPVETTETLYRFQGKVAAGKGTKLTVKEEVTQDEEIAILPADLGAVQFYARQGEIPEKVRDALVKAAQLKAAQVDTQRQINEHAQRLQQITAEQQRIRENMKTVTANSDYSNRLLKKLNDQESQIEKLQGEADQLQKTIDGQRKDMEDYLANLSVE